MPATAESLVALWTPNVQSVLAWLWQCSRQAAVVAGVVLLVRRLCGGLLTPGWRYALWSLVLLRLVVPIGPANSWSVFNLLNALARSHPQPQPFAPAPQTAVSVALPVAPAPSFRFGTLPAEPLELPPAPPVTRQAILSRAPLWLFAAWLSIAVALGARLVWTNRTFWSHVRRTISPTPPHVAEVLDRCRVELRLARAPELVVTDAVAAPALAGLFRARLLLPPVLGERLSPSELRLILLHELAHFRGRDVAIEWLWTALQLVHWFNPVLWFAGVCARADREIARDAAVLRVVGSNEADGYGSMLLRLVQGLPHARLRAGLVGVLQGKSRLRERIAWIARNSGGDAGRSWFGLAALLLVGCATLTNPRRTDTPAAARGSSVAKDAPAASSHPRQGDDADEQRIDVDAATAALNHRIDEFSAEGEFLIVALNRVRTLAGLQLAIDWRELEKVGVTPKTLVTTRTRGVTAGHLLNTLLWNAGSWEQVGYRLRGATVVISTTEAFDREVEPAIYDVRDLLVDVPDFDQPPDLSLPAPTTQPAVPTRRQIDREQKVEALINVIRQNVAPQSWTPPRQIRELQGQLIISQTTENHRSIGILLSGLRETRGFQVMVEARFVTVDEKWLDTDGPLQHALKAAPATRRAAPATRPAAQTAFDDAQVGELLQSLQADARSSVLIAPRMTLFNGQRAYVMVSTQQAYVSDLKPVVGSGGKAVAYEPVVGTVNSGIVFDVQATISADRKYVTLTLRPQLSRLERMESIPFDLNKSLVIQHPLVAVEGLKTTVSIPNLQTMVFAGFTPQTVAGAMPPATSRADGAPPVSATPPATAPSGTRLDGMGPGRRVLLLVKPTIILPEAPAARQTLPRSQPK